MPFSATPTGSARTAPEPHERGVFRDEAMFPGLIAYRLYNCMGDLVEVAIVAESWHDAEIADELRASLDRRCPAGEHEHTDPPFPGRLPFGIIR